MATLRAATSTDSAASASRKAGNDRVIAGWMAAASAARRSRSAQIRSSARMTTRPTGASSVKDRREMVEHVACRDDPGGPAILDDRDVPEAADRHLVDGDRDGVVVEEHDRVRGHEVAHMERRQPHARGLHDGVAIGEDADQALV